MGKAAKKPKKTSSKGPTAKAPPPAAKRSSHKAAQKHSQKTAMTSSAGLSRQGWGIGDVSFCETNGGEVRVTISGTALMLDGFDDPPKVYLAWYAPEAPASLPIFPEVSSGLGKAQQIPSSGVNWGPQSWDFPHDCPTTDPLHVEAVVWYHYENTFDTHMLLDKKIIEISCADIDELDLCP